MKKTAILFFLLIGNSVFGQGSLGEIIGTVIDVKGSGGLFDAKVWVDDNERLYLAKTDPDGRFRISAIPPGNYEVFVKYMEDTMRGVYVDVAADGFGNTGEMNFDKTKSQTLGDVIVTSTYTDLKIAITAIPVTCLTSKDIVHQPNKFSVASMVISMTPDVKMSEDGELIFRGSRKGEMLYLIDGVKTSEIGAIPSCAIGSITVYSGGMPAKYGDTLGGVVILETKSYFDLLKERNLRDF